MSKRPALAFAAVLIAAVCGSGPSAAQVRTPDLAAAEPRGAAVRTVTHRGARAVEVIPAGGARGTANGYAVLPGPAFANGEIELKVAGDAVTGAPESVRGFVGLAFRMQGPERYEAFYLRMKNGRAREQIQRNHSAQYISHPDHPWERLRKETPGVYESYVDLEPQRWVSMRIRVCGGEARLYVDGATQPTLTVHGLKHGAEATGAVALWVGPGTVGHFRDLKVTPMTSCVAPD